MEKISAVKSFGGTQGVYSHKSDVLSCEMKFAVYTPEGNGPFPVLYWLSGLTCTEENFITKAGAQRVAAELGLIIVAPDTSPRGEGVPDDPEGAYDFGLGAGFYLNATQEPWSKHYKMYDYITKELPVLLVDMEFPVDGPRTGIFGHSMGGHGAITIHLKNPDKFKTCSAFSPIVAPSQVPWGKKAFSNYLGPDETTWSDYDATALVARQPSKAEILIDQGTADNFLAEQLKPELFANAAAESGQPYALRMQEGYDHSYYFIASFIEDHLRWHAERLQADS
ncbi:S-formylglutathione hydrolase [Hyphococcus sp.]|uniref:S-formylglutathione hydrolase n=1 Tax=Hyphococcus sp. TaxID=2038636 RepID=UPI0035C76CA0